MRLLPFRVVLLTFLRVATLSLVLCRVMMVLLYRLVYSRPPFMVWFIRNLVDRQQVCWAVVR